MSTEPQRTLPAWVILVLEAFFLPVICGITYGIAKALDHVQPEGLGYISDGGKRYPEGGVFGVLLAIYTFGNFTCMYVRYRIVCIATYEGTCRCICCAKVLNCTALLIGAISCIGTLVLANFRTPYEDDTQTVHYVGAGIAFGGATLYMWAQAIITIFECDTGGSSGDKCCKVSMIVLRLLLAILSTVFALMALVFGMKASDEFDASNATGWPADEGIWYSSMAGYESHELSTASEWVCVFLIVIYFLSFIVEFRHFRVGMNYVVSSQQIGVTIVSKIKPEDSSKPYA